MVKLKSADIAALTGGELIGSPVAVITNLNRIEHAGDGDLTFYADKRFLHLLAGLHAACLITDRTFEPGEKMPAEAIIRVDNPYLAMVSVMRHIASLKPVPAGVHPTAVIGGGTTIHPAAYIGPGCVVGSGCHVDEKACLKANVTLYDNVSVGSGSILNASVVCYDDTVIGRNCIIHGGAVIGADGFGFVENPVDGSYGKIPQLGNVVIEDDVEIGANSTVDRAMAGSTVIGRGVKLDNLVHVAHNCEIGDHTACAAHTGISGSVKVGRRCRFGGQTGIAGHIEIADDVILMAKSGVAKSVPNSGVYFGSPIKDRLKAFKIEACISNLPEFVNDCRRAIKEIEEIKREIEEKK